jgi:phage baseplate assembly protein W
MQKDILGRGWPFPVKQGSEHRMRLLGGPEKIRESIWIILSTARGERVMLPDFGCGIHDLVFQPNTAALRGQVQVKVRDALLRWEPRIDVLAVQVDTPPEQRNYLLIRVDYQVRDSNSFYNLVYPFFVNEGAG